ncbi:MAG: hypothetical protein KDC47_03710 [Flavobacteriaceae bacterium]|nr:hypothetical protein [Flavobacteriaceae bacterium]
MADGIILHLENEHKFLEEYIALYNQLDINLEYVGCTNSEGFITQLKEREQEVKVIIFDLVGDNASEDELNGNPEFLHYVKQNFASYNLPIFIYSGHLDVIENQFDGNGTVFKVSKDVSIQVIYDKIKLLLESGFIEVFCPGGVLETEIYHDLHKAFTKQFIDSSEIEKIINNIKGENENFVESSERIKKVFKRIAIRSLLSDLLLPEVDGEGKLSEETVNSVEHYIRRIGDIPVWTGDIFKKNDSDDFLFILTPRCNVIRSESILVCPFIWKDIIKKKDKISKMLQGDPNVSGYDRHLPPSPIFEGGKLSLSKYSMIPKQTIIEEYQLHISLSDELTNEIIGKFGAHFFRTGITPWDPTEVADIING